MEHPNASLLVNLSRLDKCGLMLVLLVWSGVVVCDKSESGNVLLRSKLGCESITGPLRIKDLVNCFFEVGVRVLDDL